MNAAADRWTTRSQRLRRVALALVVALSAFAASLVFEGRSRAQSDSKQRSLLGQSQADVDGKNSGCVSCHTSSDEPSMHPTGTVRLACTDCHGGDSTAKLSPGTSINSPEYEQIKKRAHPQPNDPSLARSSAYPQRLYTKWLRESYEYVRFVNPGDLRVASETCGSAGCHAPEVL